MINPIVEIAVRESAEKSRQGPKPISYEKLMPYVLKTLPFLVQCAQSKEELPTYSDVSTAIGAGNAKNANRGFGAIMTILRMLEERSDRFDAGIPDITTIVRRKGKSQGGIGVFDRPELMDASEAQKREWVDRQQVLSRRFREWDQVLAILGITPMNNLMPPAERLEAFARTSGHASGKSQEHQAIQDWIGAHLQAAGVDVEGNIVVHQEYLFWSLDRLDVIVKADLEWVGVEVKPSGASDDEVRKGIYQVVKYQALLNAELLIEGSPKSARCILVTGGPFPKTLWSVAKRLNIRVIERVLDLMDRPAI